MLINKADNVSVNITDGHKYAVRDIKKGESVIKYGMPIGQAVCDIKKGEHVHTHNLKTSLCDELTYEYNSVKIEGLEATGEERFFDGYVRENGDVGIRNDVWIINTVGCVNETAREIAKLTGAFCFPHPYGCSQLGDDRDITMKVLKGLCIHPNAGGVLVIGLGCENNNIDEFKKVLGEYNKERIKFLNCQDFEDEIAEGVRLVSELKAYAEKFKREKISAARLKIGLKCGGSDGYSGITANPLVGALSDKAISLGGSCVLTEVPEMFGAETLLMQRCVSRQVFDKTVSLINDFKAYYKRHGQVIYENPSPGNKAGGITTLEEKSLGCVQKGGTGDVTDVISYGETVKVPGLTLLDGPGNDMVAVTNLAASGVHIILFTTGRGTPLGAPVPTVKISSNRQIADKKKNWIDFDASPMLEADGAKGLADELFDYVLRVASGEKTKNEINGYREIAVFKDGVTL